VSCHSDQLRFQFSWLEQLRFQAAAAVIPHQDKVDKGGEDAFFIAEDGLALGEHFLILMLRIVWS